jgi:hypothetical protein
MLFINASEQFKSMLSQPALRIDEMRASETGYFGNGETGSVEPPIGTNRFSVLALSNYPKGSGRFGSLKGGR